MHSIEQSLALIDVETSINDLLFDLDVTWFVPEERLDKILDNVEECEYVEALWLITNSLDPFVEHLEVSTVARLVESWTLLCRYRRLRTREQEHQHKLFCADGQQNWMAKGARRSLEYESFWLETSEAGKRKATSYFGRAESQLESTAEENKKKVLAKRPMRTFKPKCE